ncbi:MAG: hypothetical protein M3Y74_14295, partial [Chloroflexota bacterium]|nr:hypothetical protein [Chloroflexota bacterium]
MRIYVRWNISCYPYTRTANDNTPSTFDFRPSTIDHRGGYMSEFERLERTGVGDERPEEDTMNAAPGLSGGEYPGAEGVEDDMSDALTPSGEATTFGGALGDYGPGGTMGSIDEGNAVTPPPAEDDTQYGLGPASQ